MRRYAILWLLLANAVNASDVEWSRFKGTLKAINQKTGMVALQDREGDLFKLKVDSDVTILKGKDAIKLSDLRIDDKVVLLYDPKAPAPKESDEPTSGGVYPPLRR